MRARSARRPRRPPRWPRQPQRPLGTVIPRDMSAATRWRSASAPSPRRSGSADAMPAIAADDRRVIRLRTFSKAHGVAGMRVGYALGAPATIRPFDKIRNHFGMTRLSLAAALASLADPGHVAGVVEAVAAGRRDYAEMARSLGLEALPSATNFVAIDLGTSIRAKA